MKQKKVVKVFWTIMSMLIIVSMLAWMVLI